MEVYYNGNGNCREHGPKSQKLTAIPIGRTFLWEDQEILLPALYVGQTGTVLDICAKISLEKTLLFLQKWNRERGLSSHTPEEFEQMDADNPGGREFLVDICLNGEPLTIRMGSSLRWYPPAAFAASGMEEAASSNPSGTETAYTAEDWRNDRNAELLTTAYGCDRECCWYFNRLTYDWGKEPVLSPQNVSLRFKERPFPVTTAHFTTGLSCQGQQIKAAHPRTKQEYTLTLHHCEQTRHDFSGIGAEGLRYPEYCQILTYSVSPEIERSLLDIRDCAESDPPKSADAAPGSHACDGPTAVFMAWKDSAPDRRTAASSMHFAPVSETQWRVVFQVSDREDLNLSFDL